MRPRTGRGRADPLAEVADPLGAPGEMIETGTTETRYTYERRDEARDPFSGIEVMICYFAAAGLPIRDQTGNGAADWVLEPV